MIHEHQLNNNVLHQEAPTKTSPRSCILVLHSVSFRLIFHILLFDSAGDFLEDRMLWVLDELGAGAPLDPLEIGVDRLGLPCSILLFEVLLDVARDRVPKLLELP